MSAWIRNESRGSDSHGLLFFFNDTATTEIYTLSLHDALPIYAPESMSNDEAAEDEASEVGVEEGTDTTSETDESTEDRKKHTSELQSRQYLVCGLLLEKKQSATKHEAWT